MGLEPGTSDSKMSSVFPASQLPLFSVDLNFMRTNCRSCPWSCFSELVQSRSEEVRRAIFVSLTNVINIKQIRIVHHWSQVRKGLIKAVLEE